jgi:hypothetical protein
MLQMTCAGTVVHVCVCVCVCMCVCMMKLRNYECLAVVNEMETMSFLILMVYKTRFADHMFKMLKVFHMIYE